MTKDEYEKRKKAKDAAKRYKDSKSNGNSRKIKALPAN